MQRSQLAFHGCYIDGSHDSHAKHPLPPQQGQQTLTLMTEGCMHGKTWRGLVWLSKTPHSPWHSSCALVSSTSLCTASLDCPVHNADCTRPGPHSADTPTSALPDPCTQLARDNLQEVCNLLCCLTAMQAIVQPREPKASACKGRCNATCVKHVRCWRETPWEKN